MDVGIIMLHSSLAESFLVPLKKSFGSPSPALMNRNGSFFMVRPLGVLYSRVTGFFPQSLNLLLLTEHNCQQRENVEHSCLVADKKGHFSFSTLH